MSEHVNKVKQGFLGVYRTTGVAERKKQPQSLAIMSSSLEGTYSKKGVTEILLPLS